MSYSVSRDAMRTEEKHHPSVCTHWDLRAMAPFSCLPFADVWCILQSLCLGGAVLSWAATLSSMSLGYLGDEQQQGQSDKRIKPRIVLKIQSFGYVLVS